MSLLVTSSGSTRLVAVTTFQTRTSSTLTASHPAALVWTLGDGTVVTTTESSSISYRYQQPGTYLANVKALNAVGVAIASGSTTVEVHPIIAERLVTPEDAAELISPDKQVQIQVPEGAVSGVVTLTYSALLTPTVPFTDGSVPLVSFLLAAQQESGQGLTAFEHPYTIGMSTNTELPRVAVAGSGLNLAYHTTTQGWNYLNACANRDTQQITTLSKAMGEFALVRVAEEGCSVFLPLVAR